MRRAAVFGVAAALALAGCGGGNGDDGGTPAEGPATTGEAGGPLSVAQAKESGGTGLTIRGFIFADEGQGQFTLCNGLEQGSYPPICVEPALMVSNPDALADVKLAEGIGQAGGLSWSEQPVSLTGDVSGDAVTVSEIVKP